MAMQIRPMAVTLEDLYEGYVNDPDEGAFAYGGKLICRPPYQREFVYKGRQLEQVINTVLKGYPLNSIYWIANADGTYELLDGQQRTLSILEYMDGAFSTNLNGDIISYGNIRAKTRGQQFRDYEMQVYVCTGGTDEEKLDWFKVLNIAGEQLNDQEGRNAVYHGTWVSDARRLFSKRNCPAGRNGWDKLMSGSAIRQDYLQTVLKWRSKAEGKTIDAYMSEHAQDADAHALWTYYERVMTWVNQVFPKYRPAMKGVAWGELYDAYHEKYYDPNDMEKRVAELTADDEVKDKKGIYSYVFDGEERHLNLRTFMDSQKRTMFERQGGVCPMCEKEGAGQIVYAFVEMEADHIDPWCEGGKTELDNGQMLCKHHNRIKSSK